MGYLVTRPDFEIVTRIVAAYFKRYIVDPAIAKGISVEDLAGDDAVPSVFWDRIQKAGVSIVTGCGHGAEDEFTGQRYATLIKVGAYDPALIKDKWISHISCSTGAVLGPDLVEKGAKGFKGYKDTYIFYANPGAPDPTEDIYSKGFIRPDTMRHEWEIQGTDPQTADQNAGQEYANWARFWSTRDPEIADTIRYDVSIMVLITPTTPPEPCPVGNGIAKFLNFFAWLLGRKGRFRYG